MLLLILNLFSSLESVFIRELLNNSSLFIYLIYVYIYISSVNGELMFGRIVLSCAIVYIYIYGFIYHYLIFICSENLYYVGIYILCFINSLDLFICSIRVVFALGLFMNSHFGFLQESSNKSSVFCVYMFETRRESALNTVVLSWCERWSFYEWNIDIIV